MIEGYAAKGDLEAIRTRGAEWDVAIRYIPIFHPANRDEIVAEGEEAVRVEVRIEVIEAKTEALAEAEKEAGSGA